MPLWRTKARKVADSLEMWLREPSRANTASDDALLNWVVKFKDYGAPKTYEAFVEVVRTVEQRGSAHRKVRLPTPQEFALAQLGTVDAASVFRHNAEAADKARRQAEQEREEHKSHIFFLGKPGCSICQREFDESERRSHANHLELAGRVINCSICQRIKQGREQSTSLSDLHRFLSPEHPKPESNDPKPESNDDKTYYCRLCDSTHTIPFLGHHAFGSPGGP